MQNEIPTLTQGLADPIYQTSNIGLNLSKRLPKVVLILSAIILGSIVSVKAIFKLEQIIMVHRLNFDPFSKDIIKISRKRFNKLKEFAINDLNFRGDVYSGFVGQFINFYATCEIKIYPTISTLYDAKDDVNNPFHGKKYSDIVFMHPDSDPLFDAINNSAPDICKKGNSIILTEEMFNNILLNKAKLYFHNNYEISVFNGEDFNRLKLKKHFQENTEIIGPKDRYVYVANKQGTLKKYSQYIERYIRIENK